MKHGIRSNQTRYDMASSALLSGGLLVCTIRAPVTRVIRSRVVYDALLQQYEYTCTTLYEYKSNYRELQIAKSLRIGTRAPVGLSTPPAPRRSRTGDARVTVKYPAATGKPSSWPLWKVWGHARRRAATLSYEYSSIKVLEQPSSPHEHLIPFVQHIPPVPVLMPV